MVDDDVVVVGTTTTTTITTTAVAAASDSGSVADIESKTSANTVNDIVSTEKEVNLDEDEELADVQNRVKQFEDEAEKLRSIEAEVEQQMGAVSGSTGVSESKEDVDIRSVYVGNVDYSATPEEIQQHFQACGTINRVTILCDSYTGHPKGFCYVEFLDADSVSIAIALNDSLFKGRQIKISPKRTNLPAFKRGGFRGGRGGMSGRGGGFRGRGRGRGRGGVNGRFTNKRASFSPY